MASTFSRSAPAAERNKEPIRATLVRVLPQRGLVLEVASGTGQHIVHFAQAMPDLVWQPTDPDPEARASIAARVADATLPNVRPPLALDTCAASWPVESADAVICINMIHIAPWDAAEGLFTGAARILPQGGLLFLYGPFSKAGRHIAPSNADFDAELRRQNPAWGVRDLDEVGRLAEANGFALEELVEMPANNNSIIYRRC